MVELLYLIDASLPPQQLDLTAIKWLADAGTYLTIIFTKTDKIPKSRAVRDKGPEEVWKKALMDLPESPWRLGYRRVMPMMYRTSASSRTGRRDVLQHILEVRQRCLGLKGQARRN